MKSKGKDGARPEPRPTNRNESEDDDENEDDSAKLRRKLLLGISLVTNLGVLFFFKYFDFFRESTRALLHQFGVEVSWSTLGFILPVGISFYTFQTLSYTIDVYRGHLAPTRSLVQFLAYIAFFPQLVAGPIERATHLLPQMARKLTLTLPMVESGLWLFIWGLFKKVVLADSFAYLVDPVFKFVEPEASQTLIATTAFALQIYCDFSGYTDMARGMARMLGFELMLNFNLPYFATSVQDFWRRWHISLSTWLRDYLYLPLGGNRLGSGRTYLNLLIVMLLGGLWHGAAWNFVAWGVWQAFGLIVNRAWSESVGRGSCRAVEKETPVGTVAPRGLRDAVHGSSTSEMAVRSPARAERDGLKSSETMALPLSRPSGTLSPSEGGEGRGEEAIQLASLRPVTGLGRGEEVAEMQKPLSSILSPFAPHGARSGSSGESAPERRAPPRFAMPSWLGWLLTFLFTLYGWLLFRANSAEQVLALTTSLAHWAPPVWAGVMFRELLVLAAPLLAMQFWQWRSGDLEVAMRLPRWARGVLQAGLIYATILFWQREAASFIYFQF